MVGGQHFDIVFGEVQRIMTIKPKRDVVCTDPI